MSIVEGTSLHWADITVIVIYFLIVLAVGLWSTMKSKRESASGYFLANRSAHWLPVGASLFVSNVSSGLFIGLAGAGASSGIGMATFELNAIFVLLLMGWIFLPVFFASAVFTTPQYLERRFGRQRIRVYISVLYLLLWIFTRVSADLYSGALFITLSFKWDLYGSVVALLILSGFFTISGGLNAVLWTDFVQTFLILIGGSVLMVKSFQDVGGYHALIEKFPLVQPNVSYVGFNSENESCSTVPSNYMHLLRSPYDPVVPWTGTTFGLTIIAVWNWCFDQVFVQRTLSAKNLCHAKGGCILAGYLKILPLFLVVFPGMAARVLFPDEVGCSKPEVCKEICGSENGCTNIAYPLLVIHLMPPGATGLMLATMMAALVTSLTSVFNSSSTLFALDIWTRIRKGASEMEVLIVGRVFVLLMTAVSILWIPIVQSSHSSQLFQYTQSVTSCLAPPVAAVFILAMFWERINEPGAFWGLMAGQVIGIIRFVLEFVHQPPSCSSSQLDTRPEIISKLHYLHFACIQFLFTAFCTVAFSLLTKPIDKKHLYRLTFWTRFSNKRRINIGKTKREHEIQPSARYQSNSQVIALEKRNDLNQKRLESDEDLEKSSFSKGIPAWRKVLKLTCGIGQNPEDKDNQKPAWMIFEEEIQSNTVIMEEPVFWKRVCNFNGLCLLVVGIFIFSFYA